MTEGAQSNHGLSAKQLALIGEILTPFACKIEAAGLFGSRATRKYRDNSDIDLVLYGPVDTQTQSRLHTLFAESSLPFKVDVVAYSLIMHPLLKNHIDTVAVIL